MVVAPSPKEPFNVSDTVQACNGTRDVGDIDEQGALRVLTYHIDGTSFRLVPYKGQPYVAISYCWASKDFQRVGISNNATTVQIQACEPGIQSTHFSQFIARAASIYNVGRPDRTIWIDYHCINQDDEVEKMAQVSIMQRIYTRAETTLVMLEDIALSSEERAALLHFRANDESIQLVRRIISARWFTRAWCSQEHVLSRKAMFFFHNTSSPTDPLHIDSDSLWQAVDVARNYDASIPLFNVPRGLVPDSAVTRTTAYALSIVRPLGCSDEYDKISLMCNLLRSVYRFSARPTAFQAEDSVKPIIHLNVLKMANVMAIARRDFSLLIANHGRDNPFCGHLGFGWAGYPVHGDRISEMWAQKDYEAHCDTSVRINGNALAISGITARIEEEHVWEVHRDSKSGTLQVVVDGNLHRTAQNVAVDEGWTWTRDWRLLRDLLLALAGVASEQCPAQVALHARIAIAYLLAEPDYQLQPEPVLEDLALLLKRVLGGKVGQLKHIANALNFVRCDERVLFSTVLLSEGSVLLVSGNAQAGTLRDCLLFQPFVVRPKMFSPPMVMTANSMVLAREPLADGTHKCVGCVRGLGMISEMRTDGQVLQVV